MKMLSIFMIMSMMLYTNCQATTTNLHPLILIPGAGGNQLEAKLTSKYKSTSLLCNKWYPIKKDSEGWFRIWFDPSVLLAPFTKCFNQRMMLYYDTELDDYYNAPGVHTRITHFASTKSLLYLDPSLQKITAYMEPLVKALQEVGYRDGENLFGAPYDFRYGLAADGHPSHVGSKFLDDLKGLVELASNSNGGYSRMVWCNNYWCSWCANFIQPIYCGDKICCTVCGKILAEDNFVKTMAPQSKEIEETYEEAVEEDVEDTDYTEVEQECNSRTDWCDYCGQSISQPQYVDNKICCSNCGKVLHEVNFHFMAQQVIPANPKESGNVVDARDDILVQSMKIDHEREEIYEEVVENTVRMHIAEGRRM